jgi:hypothetical protein
MSRATLEQRVAELERQIALLTNRHSRERTKDWRSTRGAFTGDPVIRQIFEEGRNIRQAERPQKLRQNGKKRRSHS